MQKVLTVKSNHAALNKMGQKNKTAYRWAEPDPICDLLRDAIQYAKSRGMSLAQIAASAMCAYKTVANIDEGSTRHPMNQTCDRIFKACGFSRAIVKMAIDGSGKPIDSQTMYNVLEKIGSGKLTRLQILSLVDKTITIKKFT